VLGEGAVLIPIPLGKKGPVIKNWNKTTLADTLDTSYRIALAQGNVGVLLGKPSGGICAIDIDDDTQVEPFFALNDRLRGALRTRGSRGCQIWLRLTDETYPKTGKIEGREGAPWGEWRSDGAQSVIHGRHPNGCNYEWVVDAPALEIAFDEIVWPDELQKPWPNRQYLELVARVGEPFAGKSPNMGFFAGVFAGRNSVATGRGALRIYEVETGLWRSNDGTDLCAMLWGFTRRLCDELAAPDAKARLKQNHIEELEKLIRIESAKLPPSLSDGVVHVGNGMLDLKSTPPLLFPFAPERGSTSRIEINYDADACCPRFLAWLHGAVDEADVRLLQEWAGAVLLGPNRAQRLLLLHGDAGSGKSSFVTLVEKVVGLESCLQLRVSQLGTRFETREYAGKRLLTGKDVKADFLSGNNTGHLKSLTGGDTMTAERKMENEGVTFKGEFHVVVVSNEELALRVEGDADAWERRLLSVCMKKPETMETMADIAEVLFREEGEGILAWMVAGAARHLANGFRYDLTSGQLGVVRRIVNEADGVRLFVSQMLVIDESGEGIVTVEQLFEAYDKFAKAHDFERYKKEQLGRKLKPQIQSELGLHQRHDIHSGFLKAGATVRGYKGLILLP
jgi:P4 family phage/plasmid primase-like protien